MTKRNLQEMEIDSAAHALKRAVVGTEKIKTNDSLKSLSYYLTFIEDVDTFCIDVYPNRDKIKKQIAKLSKDEMIQLLYQAFKIDD